jgi:hypothetical protein
MKSRRGFFSAFLVILAISFGQSTTAFARGALGYDRDVCVLKIGPDFMYFTGYQAASTRKKFCEDIPSTGQTIIVLDYAQSEMREMKTDFRILREPPEGDDSAPIDAATVAYLPPKAYPNGTLNFEHNFRETGNFIGVVSVEGPHGEHWVARFPFSVGKSYTSQIPYYLIAAAAALALVLLVLHQQQSRSVRSKRP